MGVVTLWKYTEERAENTRGGEEEGTPREPVNRKEDRTEGWTEGIKMPGEKWCSMVEQEYHSGQPQPVENPRQSSYTSWRDCGLGTRRCLSRYLPKGTAAHGWAHTGKEEKSEWLCGYWATSWGQSTTLAKRENSYLKVLDTWKNADNLHFNWSLEKTQAN